MVPAFETDFMKVLRAVDEVVALGAIVVRRERHAVRVLEPLARADESVQLLIVQICARIGCDERKHRLHSM